MHIIFISVCKMQTALIRYLLAPYSSSLSLVFCLAINKFLNFIFLFNYNFCLVESYRIWNKIDIFIYMQNSHRTFNESYSFECLLNYESLFFLECRFIILWIYCFQFSIYHNIISAVSECAFKTVETVCKIANEYQYTD